MNKIKRQIFAILASSALIVSPLSSVLAATTIEISGNGAGSNNGVGLTLTQIRTVFQSNKANVINDVDAEAETGDNEIEENTGGDAKIDTGDSKAIVTITNSLNTNAATLDCCGTGNADVLISGNGAESTSDVNLGLTNTIDAVQDNSADVDNDVDAEAETGENDIEENTSGDATIETGDATTTVKLNTTANASTLTIGGAGASPTFQVRILENGSESDNGIGLTLANLIFAVQSNFADVDNDVDEAEAETGDNEIEDGTGGDATIKTGDAIVDVTIDDMVNFNYANADCGCTLDLLAKVAGNGSDSTNDINGTITDDLTVVQGNPFDDPTVPGTPVSILDSDVDAEAETGENEIDDGTADVLGDPLIETGDSGANVVITNSGGVNVYGADDSFPMPDIELTFNITLTWAMLQALLGL